MTNIIGASHSQGTFTDPKTGREIAYNNILLHITTDDDPDTIGLTASTLKIKFENFHKLTDLTPDAFPELVGKEVLLSYGIVKDKPILNKILVTGKAASNGNSNNNSK